MERYHFVSTPDLHVTEKELSTEERPLNRWPDYVDE